MNKTSKKQKSMGGIEKNLRISLDTANDQGLDIDTKTQFGAEIQIEDNDYQIKQSFSKNTITSFNINFKPNKNDGQDTVLNSPEPKQPKFHINDGFIQDKNY